MENFQDKISKLLIFFLVYTITFLLFFKTLTYTLPFVLAIIFAYILREPTRFLAKKIKCKESLASLFTTIVFFSVIVTLVYFIISSLTSELIRFTKGIQIYINNNYGLILDFLTKLQDNFNNLDPTILASIKNSILNSISTIVNSTVNIGTSIVTYLISVLSSIPYIGMVIIFTLISTYFFTKRLSSSDFKINIFTNNNGQKARHIFNHSKKMLGNYIVSYTFVIFITFIITLFGFLILRVDYAVILSLLCALLDLLPVLGMPIVYIPLIIINFLAHNYFTAIGLIILYCLVFISRQIIEPKIMSTSLGLDPVAVLAAIFIGLKANGVSGMIFCMFLVVFYNILKKAEVL